MIPKEVLDRYRAVFEKLDDDKDGCITREDVKACVKKLGHEWREEEYAEIFQNVKTPGKKLSFEQMFKIETMHLPLLFSFMMTDANGDGLISFTEMKEAAQLQPGPPVDEAEYRQLFDDMDSNGDGLISFAEFYDAFSKMIN